jgi:hypothetical protein
LNFIIKGKILNGDTSSKNIFQFLHWIRRTFQDSKLNTCKYTYTFNFAKFSLEKEKNISDDPWSRIKIISLHDITNPFCACYCNKLLFKIFFVKNIFFLIFKIYFSQTRQAHFNECSSLNYYSRGKTDSTPH